MTAKLNDEDGRAVDVLLDRPTALDGGNGDGNGHRMTFGMLSAKFQHRLQAAERILNTFGAMRAADPPMDLIQRTLRRVEETVMERATPVATSTEQRPEAQAGA